jgi:hypothetical protein
LAATSLRSSTQQQQQQQQGTEQQPGTDTDDSNCSYHGRPFSKTSLKMSQTSSH